MPNIVDALVSNSKDKIETKTQVKLNGNPVTVPVFKKDTLSIKHQATVLKYKNIAGDVLIWGNEALGIWGEFKWGDSYGNAFILGNSLSGILGTSKLGESVSVLETIRVIPPNDSFEEPFLSTYFISTSSTATVTTGNCNFNLTSEYLQSNLVYYNSTSVVNSRLTVTSTSDISNFNLYLSNNNGVSWENVSNGVLYEFIDNSGEKVKYKISSVTTDKNISNILVEINV